MEKQTEQKTNEKIKVTDIDIIVIDSKHFYYGIKYKNMGRMNITSDMVRIIYKM